MIYQNYHPWIIPFHVHPTLELHYILAGKGQIQIEDRLFSVKSNDIYVTLPFVPHQQISDADEVMEEYCISCTLSFSDAPCECPEEIDLLRRFISTQLFCSCEAPAPLLPMLKQLEWEFDHEAVYHRLQGKLLTLECVIEFLRALAGSAPDGESRRDSHYADHMALKIKSYLDINYRNKISLEDISHTFYLSTKQLNRIFQKKYHITIVSYLKELRYHSALACLKTGGFSLREAAVQCGFSGYQQLHRMLKTREADPHKPVS